MANQAREAKRPTAADRGYDWAWRVLARRVVEAQPWCSYCAATEDLSADHVIPKAKGGTDDWSNLTTACMSCQRKKRDHLLTDDGRL